MAKDMIAKTPTWVNVDKFEFGFDVTELAATNEKKFLQTSEATAEPGNCSSFGGGGRVRGGLRLLEVGGVEGPDGRRLGQALVDGGAVAVLVVGVVLLGPGLVVVRGGLLLGVRRALDPQQRRSASAGRGRPGGRCGGGGERRDGEGSERGRQGRHVCECVLSSLAALGCWVG
jgi:hypothetical protein